MVKKSQDFDIIDDEEMLRAIVEESKAQTILSMESGLKSYLKKMGKDSTFIGWISHDYPENVTIDQRHLIPHNEWELVWNKVTQDYFKSNKGILATLFTARGLRKRRKTKYNSKKNNRFRLRTRSTRKKC